MDQPPPTPRIHTRVTPRTARYATLGAEPRNAARVWFALHGYAQLAPRFLRPFAGMVPPDTCVVAPEGLNRFYVAMPQRDGSHLQRVGATWMTREAREDDIADTLRWLDALHDDVLSEAASGTPVGILAFSQGVATATRWIAQGSVTPSAFIVWAGTPAHDVDDGAVVHKLDTATVTLVCGEQDDLIGEAQRESTLERLRQWQPKSTLVTYQGGHHLDAAVLAPLLDSLPRR